MKSNPSIFRRIFFLGLTFAGMKKLKSIWNNLPKWAKNRYLIASVLFLVWMAFFDTNSFLVHRNLNQEIKELERAKARYEEETVKDLEALKKLDDDPEKLEEFARENYYMSKEGEDVFLVPEE